MLGSEAPPRARGVVPLPPEVEVSTPGAVIVVDEHGRLRDRSPRAELDAELGALEIGARVPDEVARGATTRTMVHEGAALDALVFARDGVAPSGGLDERGFEAMLQRLRNVASTLIASLDAEDLVDAAASAQLGVARRREVDRLVDALGTLGHAFAPVSGRGFVDLELIVRRALDRVRGGARRRGVALRLEGAREARRGRTGDEAILDAAVHALIANALDASTDESEIRVRVRAGPASVTIAVDDDGVGLVAPSRGKLGEPFATSKRGRLGLGLAIARRAALVHAGELRVATRAVGAGATASLWLPTAFV